LASSAERSIYPRYSELIVHLKCHFRVDPISSDFLVFHCGGEFLDVDRADISQRFGRFIHDTLDCVFPALGRFRQQFDDFNDFGNG
jgi:hypothetical protein